jgi:hypothetical protein
MALFPVGGVTRGDGEVVWAMGLLWGRDMAICVSPNELNKYKKQNGSDQNSANFSTHLPADGTIRCRRRGARGWGGCLGDETAVGGGTRQLWLVQWGSTWPKTQNKSALPKYKENKRNNLPDDAGG